MYLNCKNGDLNDCSCNEENGEEAQGYSPQTGLLGGSPTCVKDTQSCPGYGATVVPIGEFGYNCQYPANDGVTLNCKNGTDCTCNEENGTEVQDYAPVNLQSTSSDNPTQCQKLLQ